MKSIFTVITTFCLAATTNAQQVYLITGEGAGKVFVCEAMPNKNSTHYLKAISLVIENRTASRITVRVDKGTIFIAADSLNQNFIVTKEELITLAPREKKATDIYTMCTEIGDAVPSAEDSYYAAVSHDEKLLQLASFIGSKNFYNLYEAQQAIWAYCERSSLESITGYDTTASRQLQRMVSGLTGMPIPPPPAEDDYVRNFYSTNIKVRAGGAFNYEFSFTAAIRIAMFDAENRVVRELYFNAAEKPGKHRFEYEFDASVFTDSLYYIRFILNDEVLAEGEMNFNPEY